MKLGMAVFHDSDKRIFSPINDGVFWDLNSLMIACLESDLPDEACGELRCLLGLEERKLTRGSAGRGINERTDAANFDGYYRVLSGETKLGGHARRNGGEIGHRDFHDDIDLRRIGDGRESRPFHHAGSFCHFDRAHHALHGRDDRDGGIIVNGIRVGHDQNLLVAPDRSP